MDDDIPALTATPHARERLDAFTTGLDQAIAAVRAADLMTQLAARPGPRLDWIVDGIRLIGRPAQETTPEEGHAAVAAWATRLGLTLADTTAKGFVDGVDVQLQKM